MRRKASGAAQGSDDGTLFLCGLPEMMTRQVQAAQAILWPALALFGNGLGAGAITLREKAGQPG